MKRDNHTVARERWKDATEAMREQHARMREDLRFSNPAEPKQWDDSAIKLRAGRPCLTFDRTNQFIAQVVNTARQNKPQILCLPADSVADPAVAEKLNGMVRHIEYVSRAGIAYDTAIEYAARVGLGWLRVVPEIMRPETNEQEIRIKRVHDPLSINLDPNSTEPDGSDAMWGFAETSMTKQAFSAAYPKAKTQSWDSEGWFGEDMVRVCEYFYVVETKRNKIVAELGGVRGTFTEDEYWETARVTGVRPTYIENFESIERSIKWCKLSGAETLEETDFPSQFLPLIPVMGYEVWIEGKRYLCGMTRRLMDGQRAYNYERSAWIEAVALQPKAPFILDHRSVEGFENEWGSLNRSNPAYLPYNGVDEQGNALPAPQRLMPPAFPAAFAQGGEAAGRDMEAALGMFDANLGNQGTAVSGRAKLADQKRGDTANFHYIDNLSRSIEQLGRVVVDMIPRIYDTQRQARVIGDDEAQDFVEIDPSMQAPSRKEGKKVVAINPTVGAYDVRVKAGPSYISQRAESAEQLAQMLQGNPQLMPILGDVWVKMQDWPESEKVAARLKAMLPPQIQQLESEDSQDEIPPAVMAQMQQMQEQMQQMQEALQMASQEVAQAKAESESAKLNAQKAGVMAQQAKLQTDFVTAEAQIKEMMMQGQPQQIEQAVTQAAQPPAPVSVVMPDMTQTMLPQVAQVMEAGNAQMLAELQRTAETLQQAQMQAAAAIQQLAELVAAPREITLVKDDAGRNIGARSEVVSS